MAVPFEVVLDKVELLCRGEAGLDQPLEQRDGEDGARVHLGQYKTVENKQSLGGIFEIYDRQTDRRPDRQPMMQTIRRGCLSSSVS